MINFRPLGDRILVREDKPPEKIGSIYVPDIAQQKADEPGGDGLRNFIGTVVAVGPGDKRQLYSWQKCWKCKRPWVDDLILCQSTCGCRRAVSWAAMGEEERAWNAIGDRFPMYAKVGDRVVFPQRPGEIEIDGETFFIFNEEQFCYGIVEA